MQDGRIGARRLKPDQIAEVFRRFHAGRSRSRGRARIAQSLHLLVAVVLSAQATDAGVNRATAPLFKTADTPDKMLALGEEKLIRYQHHRALPHEGQECHRPVEGPDRKAWRPGAARTRGARGSCRASAARPPMSCSTSPSASRRSPSTRISSGSATAPAWRPGRRRSKSRLKLEKVVPRQYKLHAHHWLILHGRYVCKARKPECWRCLITDICLFTPKTARSSLEDVDEIGWSRTAAR